MNPMTAFALGCLAPTALFAQPPAPQPDHKAQVREIKATGCVRPAAQSRCLLLETLDGKTTYTFIAAPRPTPGTVITIQGTPHRGSTACKEGIPIDLTDWEPTGEKCAE